MKTDDFQFVYKNNRLCGVICLPDDKKPVSGMIQTFGHGKTNVADGKNSDVFFRTLTDHGMACCAWDRAGCGKSEGVYDHYQSPKDSGLEAAVAAREFSRKTGVSIRRTGFSGASRACWINTYAIASLKEAAFLIAVSSGGDHDNYLYHLETNLRIEGRKDDEIQKIVDSGRVGEEIVRTGGSYQDYLEATRVYREDPYIQYVAGLGYGVYTKEQFELNQRRLRSVRELGVKPEEELSDFGKCLREMDCPVLAIFGGRDTIVDWKDSRKLYETNVKKLTVHIFPEGNHILQRCESGSLRELFSGQNKGDYYKESMELQLLWLKSVGAID